MITDPFNLSGRAAMVTGAGQVISFPWDASELTTADGSRVECRIVGTRSFGAVSTRNTVDIGAIEWNVSLGADPAPLDPDVCGDTDGDSCDDCAIGTDNFGPLPDFNASDDGTDNDSDGTCDDSSKGQGF